MGLNVVLMHTRQPDFRRQQSTSPRYCAHSNAFRVGS